MKRDESTTEMKNNSQENILESVPLLVPLSCFERGLSRDLSWSLIKIESNECKAPRTEKKQGTKDQSRVIDGLNSLLAVTKNDKSTC